MTAQLRAELLKLRSTRTNLGLVSAMIALVIFVVVLHGFGLAANRIDDSSEQLNLVFGWAELLGSLFAALLGALSMTSEFRHGTIRPTFLVTPQRSRVLLAKVWASMLAGGVLGILAAAISVGTGSVVLSTRSLDIRPDLADYSLLVIGCGVAAALWAAIGVGLGALVRNQVPTLIGICAWLLFVEGLLLGDIGLGDVGRLTPGALAKAASGLGTDLSIAPAAAMLLLALYASAAVAGGWWAITRRDVG